MPINPKGTRAEVIRLVTQTCADYKAGQGVPPPEGPGVLTDDTGPGYSIPDDSVRPWAVVPLEVGYLADEGGTEEVVWEERVQAVYRSDVTSEHIDPQTKEPYRLFTYYALLYLAITRDGGRRDAFLWQPDPHFDRSVSPPFDAGRGTYGFQTAPLDWQWVGPL